MFLLSFCKYQLYAYKPVQVNKVWVCLLCEDHIPITSGTYLGNMIRHNSLHWRRSVRVCGNGKIFVKYRQKFSMAASSTGNVPSDNDKLSKYFRYPFEILINLSIVQSSVQTGKRPYGLSTKSWS